MRIASLPRLALIAALVVAAGCSDNKGKIDGTWASSAAKVKGKSLLPGEYVLQFLPDGHLVYTVSGRQYKGHYALGMGPAVILTLEENLEGRKIHPHKIVIDGDQLTLTSADGSEMMFVKIKVALPLG